MHIFLRFPSAAAVHQETLVFIQGPHKLLLQLTSGFPNSTPTCLGNISVFPQAAHPHFLISLYYFLIWLNIMANLFSELDKIKMAIVT